MSKSSLNKQLRRAATKGRVEEIGKLLDAGADIEAHGGFFSLGYSPLACAIYWNQPAAVKYLIQRGANVEAKDEIGDTMLSIAVSQDREDIVKMLLDAGADPRRRCDDDRRHTPLQAAEHNKSGGMIRMLEEAIFAAHAKDREASECRKREAEEREKRDKDAERARDANVVMVFSPLGDRTLQEIYNFTALERVSLVRKGEDGPVEAITRQDFDDIGDRPGLRAAFAEHQRRGGKASEKSVFPNSLQKTKPLPKETP